MEFEGCTSSVLGYHLRRRRDGAKCLRRAMSFVEGMLHVWKSCSAIHRCAPRICSSGGRASLFSRSRSGLSLDKQVCACEGTNAPRADRIMMNWLSSWCPMQEIQDRGRRSNRGGWQSTRVASPLSDADRRGG